MRGDKDDLFYVSYYLLFIFLCFLEAASITFLP